MAIHLNRSVPSSSVPFPLYKLNSFLLISLLSTEIYDQSVSVIFVSRSYRSVVASVIEAYYRPATICSRPSSSCFRTVELFGEDFCPNKTRGEDLGKLVTLDTIYWYCDGPEPTPEAPRYDDQVREQMDAAKRRAMIKAQAAKQKEDGGQLSKGTGTNNPSTKRKVLPKQDRAPKKPKIVLEPVVGLEAEGVKTVTPVKHGAGKGFMKGPSTSKEKPPVLLREDSKYALEKLSSIIAPEDYEDLGNHLTEAMGETGLFSIAQAMVMIKGLMGRCLTCETALDRIRKRTKETEDELTSLKAWKVGMEKKLDMSEKANKELLEQMETMKNALEDKEKEIKDVRDNLRQAKDVAVREYRDSDALLVELGISYAEGFDDALRQVKTSYPDLDVSNVFINVSDQTSAQPVQSESTDALFADDALPNDPRDDGVNAGESQIKLADHIGTPVEEKAENTPAQQ